MVLSIALMHGQTGHVAIAQQALAVTRILPCVKQVAETSQTGFPALILHSFAQHFQMTIAMQT
jgi:hypothetical protein